MKYNKQELLDCLDVAIFEINYMKLLTSYKDPSAEEYINQLERTIDVLEELKENLLKKNEEYANKDLTQE